MARLYELSAEFAAFADRLSEEVPPEIETELDALTLALEDKAACCVKLWRTWEAEAEGFRGEAARLAKMASVRENAAARLKAYVCRCLDAAGIAKVTTDVGKLSVRTASRPSIKWVGDDELPAELMRIRVELDGAKAFDLWKAGALPDGFEIIHSRFVQVV